MGAEGYWYFVKYQANVQQALDELREREFRAGRYNLVIEFLDFPLGPDAPSPGPQHGSIQEVLESSEEDGTRSILDIQTVGDEPDFMVATAVEPDVLKSLYHTDQPTREMVEGNMDFFEDVERGHCVYLTVYKNGQPDELLFAGYSFD